MRFYTCSHAYYCGIDLHARSMYVCVIDHRGKIRLHRNLSAEPEPLLKTLELFREDVVVGAECIFTWYWLADLCEQQRIPFVLGHALYMKAIHGGKAKNDRIDSHKIAALIRGGTCITQLRKPVPFDWMAAPLPRKDMIRCPTSCTSPEPTD